MNESILTWKKLKYIIIKVFDTPRHIDIEVPYIAKVSCKDCFCIYMLLDVDIRGHTSSPTVKMCVMFEQRTDSSFQVKHNSGKIRTRDGRLHSLIVLMHR